MSTAFIPFAEPFGYVIEIAELLAGIILIAGALLWLLAWDRVSDRVRSAVLVLIAAAAIGTTVLAINLHLANGAAHPWLIPGDSFDEGIDLDSVLPAIQIVIAWVAIACLVRLRHTPTGSERVADLTSLQRDGLRMLRTMASSAAGATALRDPSMGSTTASGPPS